MSKLTMILAVVGVLIASAASYGGLPAPVPEIEQEQQDTMRGACTSDCG